jgi:hypothetical protein
MTGSATAQAKAIAGTDPAPRDLRTRPRRVAAVVLLASLLALTSASMATAHLKRSDGSWTYRYYTHDAGNQQCGQDVGRIDPLNIVYYQYGEATRINNHSNAETDWGGISNRQSQVMCVNPSGNGWSGQLSSAEENGHGCLPPCPNQAHLRVFPAGHVHSNITDKWSTADVHHERFTGTDHVIDEDWETWENHYRSEWPPEHNTYPDYYDRVAAGAYRGFFDDGDPTRIGGLHNGSY